MKLFRPIQKLLIIFLTIAVCLLSCTEETEIPNPSNPDDRRYEGTWIGNTSQTKLISIEVENSNEEPIIKSCDIGYLKDSVYRQRKLIDNSGLSVIENGSFSFALPDGGKVSGNFLSPRSLSGSFTLLDEISGEKIMYSFDAISKTPHPDLNFIARVSYFLDAKDQLFEQDFNFYFPSQKNIETETGFIVVSGFNRKYGTLANGLPLIEIRAGHFESLDEIPRLFSPGEKKFSKNAGGGFEINYYDPEEYFYRYSTSNCTGTQDWSKLEIIDFCEIETYDPDYKLYKFIAQFHCKLCLNRRPDLFLAKGYYIGYIHNKL